MTGQRAAQASMPARPRLHRNHLAAPPNTGARGPAPCCTWPLWRRPPGRPECAPGRPGETAGCLCRPPQTHARPLRRQEAQHGENSWQAWRASSQDRLQRPRSACPARQRCHPHDTHLAVLSSRRRPPLTARNPSFPLRPGPRWGPPLPGRGSRAAGRRRRSAAAGGAGARAERSRGEREAASAQGTAALASVIWQTHCDGPCPSPCTCRLAPGLHLQHSRAVGGAALPVQLLHQLLPVWHGLVAHAVGPCGNARAAGAGVKGQRSSACPPPRRLPPPAAHTHAPSAAAAPLLRTLLRYHSGTQHEVRASWNSSRSPAK